MVGRGRPFHSIHSFADCDHLRGAPRGLRGRSSTFRGVTYTPGPFLELQLRGFVCRVCLVFALCTSPCSCNPKSCSHESRRRVMVSSGSVVEERCSAAAASSVSHVPRRRGGCSGGLRRLMAAAAAVGPWGSTAARHRRRPLVIQSHKLLHSTARSRRRCPAGTCEFFKFRHMLGTFSVGARFVPEGARFVPIRTLLIPIRP
jgi:hypothetical protein